MAKTRDELHDELDALVPHGTKRRSAIRIIGHCLIDAGRITVLECPYSMCSQESRAFVGYSAGAAGSARVDPRVISIDHIVSVSDGGSDRPENLQLMHAACNAGKGSRDAWSHDNPRAQARRSANAARMTERMADEEYARMMRERMTGMSLSEESRLKRSESMKRVWADPARRKKLSEGVKKSWETRRRSGE